MADLKDTALTLVQSGPFQHLMPELANRLAEQPSFQELAAGLMKRVGFKVDFNDETTDYDDEASVLAQDTDEYDRACALRFFVAEVFLAGSLHAQLHGSAALSPGYDELVSHS